MPEPIQNPILPGCYPDPSITRAGDDFYLVASSFEYFPGLPLFHSTNLREWRQLGHVLTRSSQLVLRDAASSQGIYAPTLRYHQGRFFVITTNMSHGGTFIVWSDDPLGPWSDPIFVREDTFTMDPSLLFVDDAVYYTRHGGRERGAIYQARIDVMSGALDRTPVEIWRGTGGIWPEGPHLYAIGEYYYLLIAEGGTSYGHAVTVARARDPFGPFEACPHNPILTHRERRDAPLQATGHGDLVQAPDGSWWMVFLGIRPWDKSHHHLGRETFIAPVSFTHDGWPMVNGGRPIELPKAPAVESAPAVPREVAAASGPHRATAYDISGNPFAGAELSPDWVWLRNPTLENYSLHARPGWLRLRGTAVTLRDAASPSFVGVRQRAYQMRIATRVAFTPKERDQWAGLVLRMNEQNHYALLVGSSDAGPRVQLVERLSGSERVCGEVALPSDECRLVVRALPDKYVFSVESATGTATERTAELGALDTLPLSSEVAGGFTGVVIGLYATGVGAQADFTDFEAVLG